MILRLFCRVHFAFYRPGKEKHFLAIVVIVKNEETYIREWLEYHRLVGISHVYLYDNGSTDKTSAYVRPYEKDGFVTKRYFPGRGMQSPAYNDALRRYGKECRYMAFIDGDKRTYVETYEMVLPLMSKGGWILADNTLWDGHVIDPEYARDNQTKGIRNFNDVVANDDRVEKVMIPLRDGLTLIRKK